MFYSFFVLPDLLKIFPQSRQILSYTTLPFARLQFVFLLERAQVEETFHCLKKVLHLLQSNLPASSAPCA